MQQAHSSRILFLFFPFHVGIGPHNGKLGSFEVERVHAIVQVQSSVLANSFFAIVLEFKGVFVSHNNHRGITQIMIDLRDDRFREAKEPPCDLAGAKGRKKDSKEVSQLCQAGPQQYSSFGTDGSGGKSLVATYYVSLEEAMVKMLRMIGRDGALGRALGR